MKTHTALTWVCGAAAVILAGSVLLSIISQDKSMEICIGTYGDNLYIYESTRMISNSDRKDITKQTTRHMPCIKTDTYMP